ncbi:single-stranded-DNA-specific exonuclease RecJ [Filimonas sp.]|nr:single-stranded-DNA-specific exonuclease RecJ [Filimonas sp.]
MEKKWILKPTDDSLVEQLQRQLKIHPALCALLEERGIRNYDEAKDFFRTSENHLHDPFLMKGMDEAVSRIFTAIANKERILIYGDYDVDGTTAVAVAYSFFTSFYHDIEYYIPHRFTEGYGLSKKGLIMQSTTGLH